MENPKDLIPEGLSRKEKLEMLDSMASKVEETTYYVPLTQDDLDQRREKLTDNFIKLSDLEAEKKEFIDEIKAKAKPYNEENTGLMQEVRMKSKKVDGLLYHIDDQDAGMMHTYTEDGQLHASRRLRPDEKQSTIFSISKAQ